MNRPNPTDMYGSKLTIDKVIPWGKTLHEHQQFFNLQDADLDKNIACFGDGASSMNAELTRVGRRIVSFDPIYQFSAIELGSRFRDVLAQFKTQVNQVANSERSMIEEVISCREKATREFLKDYELGKEEKRYVSHQLPDKILFKDNYFDISLCSHFLLLYDQLGINFHLQSISEIMRVSKELRIFPTINLYGKESSVLNQLIKHLIKNKFTMEIISINYKFNRVGMKMLKLGHHGLNP